MTKMPIRELQCPGCKRNVRFRMNEKGQIVSSCTYCGWKPGSKHKISKRYVLMEDIKGNTKMRVKDKIT